MSLINDALKRAAQKPPPAPGASELAADLQPVNERPSGIPVVTLLIMLIPMIALGLWFLAKRLQLNELPTAVPAKTVVARNAEAASMPAPVPVVVRPTNAPMPASSPSRQIYKLQGIYWRPLKPSAVVNGKTIYIGDRVENARVTAIDQQSVTLSIDGEPKLRVLR